MSDGGESKRTFMQRHWTDTLFAFAALFVSAISLWVGIRTEDANEKLVAASTWPFMQIGVDNATAEGTPYLKFNVINTGVGPAKIESFEVFYNGKPFRSGRDLLIKCCGWKPPGGLLRTTNDGRTRFLSGTVQGIVLRSGDSEMFIGYPLKDDNVKEWNALNNARPQITYRICYCSVLDECWRNSLTGDLSMRGQLHPEQVKTCPVPPVAYTQ